MSPSSSILIILFIFLSSLIFNVDAIRYDYAITIDAGSTGTRFYIYQWEHRHASSTIPPFSTPITQAAWSAKIKPGISSLVTTPTLDATYQYMIPFLKQARDVMHDVSSNTPYDEIPIMLKATAGMRVIPDIALRDRIMENIRTVFSNKTICPFAFNRATGARIISGEEEAIFGWLTVNHLLSTLQPPVGEPAHTWGAMDLGGASTQLTFDPSTELLANSFAIDIPTHPYLLYAHSHLYFGIEQLVNRSIESVLESHSNGVFFHPCYATGYTHTMMTSVGELNITGTSDVTACRENIYKLLSKSAPCYSAPSPSSCSIAGVYQPSIPSNMSFIAFSSFGYIAQDSGLGEYGTMEELSLLVPTICSLNYTQLIQHFPKQPDLMERLCLHLTYALTLLHDGYGFPLTNDRRLRFTNKINGTQVEWPLGATLYEINALSYELDATCSSSSDETLTRWLPLGVAIFLLVCITLAGIRYLYRRQSHLQHDDWKTSRDVRQHEPQQPDDADVEQPLSYSRVDSRNLRAVDVESTYR